MIVWLRSMPETGLLLPNKQGYHYAVAVDYSGQDLRGRDFAGVDLMDANLSNANLTNANLTWTNLTNANLSGANLSNARMVAVKLNRANLYNADLTNANLYKASLENANLTNANLNSAFLSEANLSDVVLSNVKYTHGTTWPFNRIILALRVREFNMQRLEGGEVSIVAETSESGQLALHENEGALSRSERDSKPALTDDDQGMVD